MADQATVTSQKAILAKPTHNPGEPAEDRGTQRKLDLPLRNQKKLDAIPANQKGILAMLR
jgi:hypothetical protein